MFFNYLSYVHQLSFINMLCFRRKACFSNQLTFEESCTRDVCQITIVRVILSHNPLKITVYKEKVNLLCALIPGECIRLILLFAFYLLTGF